jgi:hypothetical protein
MEDLQMKKSKIATIKTVAKINQTKVLQLKKKGGRDD